jgi:hypothetical protein
MIKNIWEPIYSGVMSPACSNCGTDVDPSAAQCPACGAQFEEEQSVLESVPASWLGIGVGVLIVALLSALNIVGPVLMVGVGAGIALMVWILAEFMT